LRVVVALEPITERELLPPVVECLLVVAQRGEAFGEGVVQAQQVIVGVVRRAGEFGLEQDDLQPGVGLVIARLCAGPRSQRLVAARFRC
jgi:hypothetical protein